MLLRFTAATLLCAAAALSQTPIDTLIESGHYKRARAAIEAQYKEKPNDADTLRTLSFIRQRWGKLDEAEKLAEKAVALNPKDARNHYQLEAVLGEKAQNAGVLHQIGLGRAFKKEADATLQLDPNHVGALKDMMMFYLMAPGIIGGDKAKAQAIVTQIMKVDPVEGYTAQMTLAHEQKQTVDTEALLRKTLEARPDSYPAHTNLAAYLLSQKKYDEAERQAREAIRLRPDRVAAYGIAAVALVQQDKWADLDTLLTAAEKAVPDDFTPYLRAANNCLNRKTELARAERYFRKYLTLEPEPGAAGRAVAHWRLALALEQLGRKPEAVAELEASIRLNPNRPEVKADLKRIKG